MATAPFSDFDEKYRCWCNMHVMGAVQLIAYVKLALLAISTLLLVVCFFEVRIPFIIPALLATASLSGATLVSLLFATRRHSRALLLPYLVGCGFGLIFLTFHEIYFFAIVFTTRSAFREGLNEIEIILSLLVGLLVIGVESWLWHMVFKCFGYFTDKANWAFVNTAFSYLNQYPPSGNNSEVENPTSMPIYNPSANVAPASVTNLNYASPMTVSTGGQVVVSGPNAQSPIVTAPPSSANGNAIV